MAGANVWQRFRAHHLPAHSSGFISGFLLTFITTMRELSLIILLVTPATQLLASQTMFYTENGDASDGKHRHPDPGIASLSLAISSSGVHRGGSLKKGLGCKERIS